MLVWRIQSWVKCLCLAYRSLFHCPNLWLYILSICWWLSKFSISTPDLSSKLHICVCKCFLYQADWLINRQNGTLGSFLSCSLNISFLRFAISVNNITAAQLLRPKILRLIFDLARSKVAVPAYLLFFQNASQIRSVLSALSPPSPNFMILWLDFYYNLLRLVPLHSCPLSIICEADKKLFKTQITS